MRGGKHGVLTGTSNVSDFQHRVGTLTYTCVGLPRAQIWLEADRDDSARVDHGCRSHARVQGRQWQSYGSLGTRLVPYPPDTLLFIGLTVQSIQQIRYHPLSPC
jgi:hypothetical protein